MPQQRFSRCLGFALIKTAHSIKHDNNKNSAWFKLAHACLPHKAFHFKLWSLCALGIATRSQQRPAESYQAENNLPWSLNESPSVRISWNGVLRTLLYPSHKTYKLWRSHHSSISEVNLRDHRLDTKSKRFGSRESNLKYKGIAKSHDN